MKPWKTLSSKQVYENNWMKIRHDEIERPNNTQGIYGVVDKAPSCVLIPEMDNKIYLVEQFRYPVMERSWEFPQGNLEGTDTIEQTAKRELQEETGLISDKLIQIGTIWTAPGFINQLMTIFIAPNCRPGERHLEESEEDMIVKGFTLEELKHMIKTSAIKDSPTIASFAHYLIYKGMV